VSICLVLPAVIVSPLEMKMRIANLVEQLMTTADCSIRPPTGQPETGMTLPTDVIHFYQLTGGAILFEHAEYPIEIISPTGFVRANPLIIGDEGEGDISFDWFVIAQSGEQYITIDLNPTRIGRCYDSFWDRHGLAGDCPVVATCFESLLEQLLKNEGRYWYWIEDNFNSLGDAYD